MKMLSAALFMLFTYSASLAQNTNYEPAIIANDDLPIHIEIKKVERVKLGDLKGPRAKNYPTHKYTSSQVMVEVPTKVAERLKGPEAKNYKPWKDDTRAQQVVMKKAERKNLKGPRAKNRKPWKN